MNTVWVLTIQRKGSLFIGPVIDESLEKLQAHAAKLDGSASLTWQQYGGELGAHSAWDDERSYSISPASRIPE